MRLLGTRPRVESPPAPELHLGPFTWQTRPEDVSPDDKLLGIYVYTPYYKTATAALKSHGAASTAQVCEVVPDRVPHVPVGLFDAVVPLRPQRFPEFPAFLHLPSIIKHQGPEGHAGIVLDLTRVGGRYFATVLPKRLEYDVLLRFVTPLTWHSDLPLCAYAAFFQNPWPARPDLDCHSVTLTIARTRFSGLRIVLWTNWPRVSHTVRCQVRILVTGCLT